MLEEYIGNCLFALPPHHTRFPGTDVSFFFQCEAAVTASPASLGYLAPELVPMGKVTLVDVFASCMFVL
jgi:hypothetical protein